MSRRLERFREANIWQVFLSFQLKHGVKTRSIPNNSKERIQGSTASLYGSPLAPRFTISTAFSNRSIVSSALAGASGLRAVTLAFLDWMMLRRWIKSRACRLRLRSKLDECESIVNVDALGVLASQSDFDFALEHYLRIFILLLAS